MKNKLSTIFIGLLMLSGTAIAQHQSSTTVHNHYYNKHHHRHQYHRHHNDYVVPAIITGIGAAIIVDRLNRREEPREVIVEEIIIQGNPNIPRCSAWREIITYDGRVIRERICER